MKKIKPIIFALCCLFGVLNAQSIKNINSQKENIVYDIWNLEDTIEQVIKKADKNNYCIGDSIANACYKTKGFKTSDLYSNRKGLLLSKIYYSEKILNEPSLVVLEFSSKNKLKKINIKINVKEKNDVRKKSNIITKHFNKKYGKTISRGKNILVWKYEDYFIKLYTNSKERIIKLSYLKK